MMSLWLRDVCLSPVLLTQCWLLKWWPFPKLILKLKNLFIGRHCGEKHNPNNRKTWTLDTVQCCIVQRQPSPHCTTVSKACDRHTAQRASSLHSGTRGTLSHCGMLHSAELLRAVCILAFTLKTFSPHQQAYSSFHEKTMLALSVYFRGNFRRNVNLT